MEEEKLYLKRNPVLDYYKKYSQNKNLTKYFRGREEFANLDSGSNDSSKQSKTNDLVLAASSGSNDKVDVSISIEVESSHANVIDAQTETEGENVAGLSPSSSITSNRKLEWDNGADIGYANISERSIHKSLSLPTLNTLEKVISEQPVLRQSPDGKPAERSQNSNQIIDNISEFSLECDTDKNRLSSTTSSFRKSTSYRTTSTSSARAYDTESPFTTDEHEYVITLIQEQRQPLAESTPQINANVSKKRESRRNSKLSKHVKSSSSNKEDTTSNVDDDELQSIEGLVPLKPRKDLKLCVSKPLVVECITKINSDNKLIQTTLPHNVSAYVQTDSVDNKEEMVTESIQNKQPNYVERQQIIYAIHSDNLSENAGEMTKSNSFEYIGGNQLDEMVEKSKESSIKSANSTDKTEETPKLDDNSIAKDVMISPNAESSLNSPLSELMLKKRSSNLIQDLEKSIELLQQILKSEEHDTTTKKKYICRIVKKMIQNKYNDDSSDSSIKTDNGNDRQTRNKEILEQLQKNVPWKPVEIIKFNSKEPDGSKEQESSSHQFLQKNKRETVSSGANDSNDANKESDGNQEIIIGHELQVNPVSQAKQIPANDVEEMNKSKEELIKPTYEKVNKPRHSLFTITNSHTVEPARLSVENNVINSEPSTINEMRISSGFSSIQKTSDSTSPNSTESKRSWKDEKTLSEKLLEKRQTKGNEMCGDNKDAYLNFNNFPKENQLNWISNEINHLHNLRKILEGNQEDIRKALLDNPHENLKINPPPTSVYVVTTERERNVKSKTKNKATQYATEIDMKIGFKRYKLKTVPCTICKKHFCDCEKKVDDESSEKEILVQNPTESSGEPAPSASNDKSEPVSKKFCNKCKGICIKPNCSMYKSNSSTTSGLSEIDAKCKEEDCVKSGSDIKIAKKPNEPIVIVLKLGKSHSKDSQPMKSSSTTTTSSSTTTSDVSICPCCNKRFGKSESTIFKDLVHDINNVCPKCYMADNGMNYVCQRHMHCNSYACVDMKTLNAIKSTVRDLNELEKQRNACTCKYKSNKDAKGCKRCDRKRKHKKGIAYTLNLVPERCKKMDRRKQSDRKNSLESVTIEIPYGSLDSSKGKCKPCDDDSDSDTEDSKENKKAKQKCRKKKKRKANTLQDCLVEKRPDFLQAAEDRRRYLVELAYLRSKRIEKYKRLLALTTQTPYETTNCNNYNNKPKSLYSTKQMKEITAKTYNKLAEVREKKAHVKKQQIEKANRLITNIFNEKLRRKVLNGQKDFSTSTSVINL